jgi:hypothetical protein
MAVLTAPAVRQQSKHLCADDETSPEFEPVAEEQRGEILIALGLASADANCRSTAGGTTHVLSLV